MKRNRFITEAVSYFNICFEEWRCIYFFYSRFNVYLCRSIYLFVFMSKIGSLFTPAGRKALLLGSGELGKEVAIELQRLGVEVVACDKYANAPAMQIAHRSYVFNMLDGEELDVKAVLSFSTTVMKSTEFMAIEEVTEQEIDSAVLAELPSAVIYITAPGDDLWSIGRKYHMPVKAVRELNALESDELKPGRKLLLVKGL